ncbi:MAG TPA: hypothetical protein VF857_01545 [Spirochaetota bacterium]
MRKRITSAIAVIALFCAMTSVYAADKSDKKITVKFTAEELAFSVSALNSIELTGEEVGPFVEIKNLFIGVYKDASAGKKQSAEVTFSVPMAKNFLFFMQRVKIKGAEASIFNDITTKMVDAIKKETK